MSDLRDQAIALAGLFQSVALVRDIARLGTTDEDAFGICIASVLRIDAPSPDAVYDGPERLICGLGALLDQLGARPGGRDREMTGYAARVVDLERRLARRPDLLAAIRAGVEDAAALAAEPEPGGSSADEVVARLATIYVETVSTLGPKVMVSGEPQHLRNPRNAERVRALLLAAVRAAVLWRQLGGSRIRLLIGRRSMAAAANGLLDAVRR